MYSDIVLFHQIETIKEKGKMLLKIFADIDEISVTVAQTSSEIISILSKIRSSKFLKHVMVFLEYSGNETFSIGCGNFYQALLEFSFLETQLEQYDFDKETVVYRKATEKEIAEWIDFKAGGNTPSFIQIQF